MSIKKPDRGVVINGDIHDKLPKSDISVSVMALFRVVFVADENSLSVDEGNAYIIPKFKVKLHTETRNITLLHYCIMQCTLLQPAKKGINV